MDIGFYALCCSISLFLFLILMCLLCMIAFLKQFLLIQTEIFKGLANMKEHKAKD